MIGPGKRGRGIFMKRRCLISLVLAAAVMLILTGCSTKLLGADLMNAGGEGAAGSSVMEIDNSGAVDTAAVPAWSGRPSVVMRENEPGFTDEEIKAAKAEGLAPDITDEQSAEERSFPESTDGISEIEAEGEEALSPVDHLGRCGAVTACVSPETMPEGDRGSIGMIRPSGWPENISEAKYDFIEGKYLYNRCHLVGWQLTGEDAEERNLITGTRYMNVEGMLPYENQVAAYVKDTGNRVLYRATPDFENDELIARGVQLEALSVDDGGEGVSFNVYCYNVQPQVEIDYMTGESSLAEDAAQTADTAAGSAEEEESAHTDEGSIKSQERDYILNANPERKRYHLPGCNSVKQIKKENKKEFRGTANDLENQGYKPCGNCRPDIN